MAMFIADTASAFVAPSAAVQHPTAQQTVHVSAPLVTGSAPSSSCSVVACGAVGLLASAALAANAKPARSAGKRDQRIVSLTAFENELGVQAPVGFWDPMGLSADGDEATFKRRRATELKHGRVSMYATIGYIVPEYFKFPGYLAPTSGLKFADVPNGLAALSKVPVQGWAQIVILAGTYEFPTYNSNGGLADPTAPGDLGWKAITSSDPEEKKRKLNAELANGRLAMMAIMGMLYQDGLTGSAWGDWSLYTDSPLRAFENELGVQAPVGFWDPVGFTADGDVAAFKRRRSVELKHGRISMMACMGFMTPEITGKLPGELSPSNDLKFADIPNGIGAISKVPALGWAQIIAYFGYVEIAGGFEDYKSGTPGDYGFKVLTSKDPEALTAKLNAELANSRLAMTAIMAMIFQNGTVGNTGPEMWLGSRGAFENELGVQAPVGFWDPVGFTADGDVAAFKRRRSVELKHGRISMMACMGFMTPEITGKLPGELSPSNDLKFADIPNGIGAISKVPALGWAQIIAYFGYVEIAGGFEDYKSGTPGDYGFKVLTSKDPEALTAKLNAELANSRLAMTAIMAMIFQNGTVGNTGPEMWLGSRGAFENELGVQAPVGFWDPVGFTADGDVAAFKRRRSVELKHGRISMMACMGFMTPEITGKLPGELSPSNDLKFADIPNGIGAISKVPALGWAQIIAYFGYVEIAGGFEDYKSGTPGDYGFKVLTSKDPEALTAKLNAELANSRLAMTAIMAMIFQNGTVGNTGPEMWLGSRGAFENELGVQKPVGFWDPLGFTKDCSVADFKRRRAVELKHGRLCMLACMGYMTPDITGKFPGYLSPSMGIKFADVPNGLGALSKVPALGWAQIVAYGGFIEISSLQEDYEDPECKPGNFGFKVITSDDPEVLKTKLNAEIANGRLAMFAIMGMMFQNGFTGTSGPGMWLPGNAFENELGVQAPVGFWDPAGFTKAGDEALFKRHRGIEIKHGRVSMWACMGYITPEYFKWPGYCSPSANLKFADIPNGLAALSKVPAAGFAQMFLFAGLIDTSYFRADESRDAGNFANGGVLGVPRGMDSLKDPEERSKKLNAEIANGRLAMMAIIGMFFQDGLTGSAWGDWALYTASPLR